MFVLRYAYQLALGVWLGSMLALGGLVAPAIFSVMAASGGVDGRTRAGELFGAILDRFQYVSYGAAIVMLLCLGAMALLTRPRGVGIRALLVAGMLAVSLYSGRSVNPRAAQLRTDIAGPVQTLSENDPRRRAFDGLHQLSTQLMLVNVVGCLVLLGWEARARVR